MTRTTIIVDSVTVNNLYYAGGEASWDKLLKQYDVVVVPDVVANEVTTAT